MLATVDGPGMACAELDLDRLRVLRSHFYDDEMLSPPGSDADVLWSRPGQSHDRRPELYGELTRPQADAFEYHYGAPWARYLATRVREDPDDEGDLMAVEAQNRVQLAASHWKPRFVANGIDLNDFERALAMLSEWKDWAPYWRDTGDAHKALADAATRAGHTVTATEAYQRAAWSYHLGKFLWFEDRGLHEDLARRTVDAYRKALPGLDPPGERVELPFEGAVVPGNLRRPRGVARPPVVLMVPGLDSVKEELFAMENDFLKRGLATLSVDGPGQGENDAPLPDPPGLVRRGDGDHRQPARAGRRRPRTGRPHGHQHGRDLRPVRRGQGEAAPRARSRSRVPMTFQRAGRR